MKKNGFTLVELMVVVTIMGIMTSFSLASWTNYREKKVVESVGLELVSQFRLIRFKAINGEKPVNPECLFFSNYQIDVAADCDLVVTANCRDGTGSEVSISPETIELDSLAQCGIASFKFQSLSGVVDEVESITVTYNNKTKQIDISESGEIELS